MQILDSCRFAYLNFYAWTSDGWTGAPLKASANSVGSDGWDSVLQRYWTALNPVAGLFF